MLSTCRQRICSSQYAISASRQMFSGCLTNVSQKLTFNVYRMNDNKRVTNLHQRL